MVNVVLRCRREAPVAPRRAAPLLDGIRRTDWAGRPALARRLGAVLADRGEVAYCEGGFDEASPERRGTLRTAAQTIVAGAKTAVAASMASARMIARRPFPSRGARKPPERAPTFALVLA